MKHLIGRAVGSLVLLAAILVTGAIAQEQREAEQKGTEEAQESALQQEAPAEYACPECPGIRATWAATCPKCGATLQRVEDVGESVTVRRAARLTDERFAAQLQAAIAEQLEALRKAQGMPEATEETPAQGETTRRLSTFIDMITPLVSDKELQEKMEPVLEWVGVAMDVPLSPYDPGMLLARRDELRLTGEQAGALEAIAEDAREQGKGLLTDAQKEMLKGFDETPTTLGRMTEEVTGPVVRRLMEEMQAPADVPSVEEARQALISLVQSPPEDTDIAWTLSRLEGPQAIHHAGPAGEDLYIGRWACDLQEKQFSLTMDAYPVSYQYYVGKFIRDDSGAWKAVITEKTHADYLPPDD